VTSQRFPLRSLIVVAAIVSALIPLTAVKTMAIDATPSGCTSIEDIPVTYGIEYGAAIQGIFNDFDGMGDGCVDCHVNPMPAGGLSLESGISWGNLVAQPSNEDASLIYVVPKSPKKSLLFQKVNCDSPDVGDRMPLGFGDLSPEQQALIYDWIAEGAPSGTTDDIFHNDFDPRGFVQ
jgi:hypothetical protein